MATIEELHEAAGRLHACAWHGRKSVGEASRAMFSIPRQPTDDDNLIYAAIEELAVLRATRRTALLDKSYDGEDIANVGRDVDEAIDEAGIPLDEYGFADGQYRVVITFAATQPNCPAHEQEKKT